MNSLLTWIRYQLERWVLRGSLALVLLLVSLLSAIATLGGLVAYFLPGHHFPSIPTAMWWAILRISDPGYLSDDIPNAPTRILSMFLSVMGMTVTVGGVVAIVTQSMNRALNALAAATTPVPFTDHVVLVGITDRTPTLLKILLADQAEEIVVLVSEITREATHQVQRVAGIGSARNRIVLRSGQSQRIDELARTRCARARAVIFSATARAVAGDPEAGPRLLRSLSALKALLAKEQPETPPAVVVELVDRSLLPIVYSVFPDARVLSSDRVVARTLRLSLQARGMAAFAFDVYVPRVGNELTVVSGTSLGSVAGMPLGELDRHATGALLLGTLTDDQPPHIKVDWQTPVTESSRLLAFGPHLPRFDAVPAARPIPVERAQQAATRIDFSARKQTVLVLGWNEVAPDLVAELLLEPEGRYEVDFLSKVPVKARKRELRAVDPERRLRVRHIYAEPMTIGVSELIDLKRYSRFLVLADRSVPPETADERTLAVSLSLRRRKTELAPDNVIALELLAEENVSVVSKREIVITPVLSANLLCTLALSKESGEGSARALSQQTTAYLRVVSVPTDLANDPALLTAAVRSAGYALVHHLPAGLQEGTVPIVVCEDPDSLAATNLAPTEEVADGSREQPAFSDLQDD